MDTPVLLTMFDEVLNFIVIVTGLSVLFYIRCKHNINIKANWALLMLFYCGSVFPIALIRDYQKDIVLNLTAES